MEPISSIFESFIRIINTPMSLSFAVFFELFSSFFWGYVVFIPISQLFFQNHQKEAFYTLISTRISLLVIANTYSTGYALADFILFFVFATLVSPIYRLAFPNVVTSDNSTKIKPLESMLYTGEEITKIRHIISVIYGILAALVVSSKLIIDYDLAIYISLLSLLIFYIYIYFIYLKKQINQIDTNIRKSNIVVDLFILLVTFFGISSVGFINPRIIYSCNNLNCEVKKYVEGIKKEEVVEIPDKHNNKPVFAIDSYAFNNINSIKKVILPSSVIRIDENAFVNCKNLESIEVSEQAQIKDGAIPNNIEIIKK